MELAKKWSQMTDTKDLIKRLQGRWIEKTRGARINRTYDNPTILTYHIERNIRTLIQIIKDIDKVEVSKTIDTKTYIITLVDSKNNRLSLWLDSKNNVNSITPY